MKELLDEIWNSQPIASPSTGTLWSFDGYYPDGSPIFSGDYGKPCSTPPPEPPSRDQLSLFKRVGNREILYSDLTPGGTNLTSAL